MPKRIDSWMPEYDFSERHGTRVRAAPPVVWDALGELDMSRLWLVRILMGLRGILVGIRAPERMTVRGFFREGVVLEDEPPRELVLGLTGRFWTPAGGLVESAAASFRAPPPPGTARAAWSFRLTPTRDGGTELETETRIRCADAAARRAFARYWLLIRPGSGLIRKAILRAVRRTAERPVAR